MFSYCNVFLYITVNRYTICKLLALISSSLVGYLLYWFPVHNKGTRVNVHVGWDAIKY